MQTIEGSLALIKSPMGPFSALINSSYVQQCALVPRKYFLHYSRRADVEFELSNLRCSKRFYTQLCLINQFFDRFFREFAFTIDSVINEVFRNNPNLEGVFSCYRKRQV